MRAVLLLTIFAGVCCAQDARELVARAVAADNHSYRLALDYTYRIKDDIREFDATGGIKSDHSTLDEVMYVGGKRYFHPLEKDGKPLPASEAAKEQAKLDRAAAEAGKLSEAEHRKRIEDEERDIAKRRAQFRDIPDAFDYRLVGEQSVAGRAAWEITAKPRAAYHGELAHILHNLEGTLWIDKQDGNWVKFEADVLQPFSLGWFLARVGDGTHLSYELMPVGTPGRDEFWVPKSLSLKASARLALLKKVRVDQEVTFSDYRKFQTDARIVSSGE